MAYIESGTAAHGCDGGNLRIKGCTTESDIQLAIALQTGGVSFVLQITNNIFL